MRSVLLLAVVALAGCGTGKSPPAPASSPRRAADPVAAQREADAQAAFSLDTAEASIKEALDASKKLAPIAGGDAKDALLDVADMLDSAGATLADHDSPPPALEEYRKTETEQSAARQKAVTDALDALHELRDASGTLDDLSQNAPPEHAKSLDAIGASTDESIKAVEEAINRLGGKVPPEDDGDDPQSSKDRS